MFILLKNVYFLNFSQALVQFSDEETATAAKNALYGRSIPRYLLAEQVGQCSLKITYSAHTDLTVKFHSHRSRDYTNPYLPIAPSAIDSTGQVLNSNGVVLVEFFAPWCPVNLNRMLLITRRSSLRELVSRIVRQELVSTAHYGSTCKYHHPMDMNGAQPVMFNFIGLPMRLGDYLNVEDSRGMVV
ncbi:unnamed protein product [Arabidopsis halleri]